MTVVRNVLVLLVCVVAACAPAVALDERTPDEARADDLLLQMKKGDPISDADLAWLEGYTQQSGGKLFGSDRTLSDVNFELQEEQAELQEQLDAFRRGEKLDRNQFDRDVQAHLNDLLDVDAEIEKLLKGAEWREARAAEALKRESVVAREQREIAARVQKEIDELRSRPSLSAEEKARLGRLEVQVQVRLERARDMEAIVKNGNEWRARQDRLAAERNRELVAELRKGLSQAEREERLRRAVALARVDAAARKGQEFSLKVARLQKVAARLKFLEAYRLREEARVCTDPAEVRNKLAEADRAEQEAQELWLRFKAGLNVNLEGALGDHEQFRKWKEQGDADVAQLRRMLRMFQEGLEPLYDDVAGRMGMLTDPGGGEELDALKLERAQLGALEAILAGGIERVDFDRADLGHLLVELQKAIGKLPPDKQKAVQELLARVVRECVPAAGPSAVAALPADGAIFYWGEPPKSVWTEYDRWVADVAKSGDAGRGLPATAWGQGFLDATVLGANSLGVTQGLLAFAGPGGGGGPGPITTGFLTGLAVFARHDMGPNTWYEAGGSIPGVANFSKGGITAGAVTVMLVKTDTVASTTPGLPADGASLPFSICGGATVTPAGPGKFAVHSAPLTLGTLTFPDGAIVLKQP